MKIVEDSPCAFCRSIKGQNIIEKCKNLAEKRGDAEAMGFLGQAYLNGEASGCHVPKDELQGMGWYVRAAETGHPMALVNVAVMCSQGTVLEKNVNFAEKFAVAAAKKGCVNAHGLLGAIYWRECVEADSLGATQTKILDHWKFAAAGGCRKSMKQIERFCDQNFWRCFTEEEADRVKEEFERAAKVEWTEEREEWKRDQFRGKFKG